MVVGTGWMGMAVLTNDWVNLNAYDCVNLNGSSGLAMVDGLAVVDSSCRILLSGGAVRVNQAGLPGLMA